MSKEELLFVAEGTTVDGKTRRVSVYQIGKSFMLRSMSPTGHMHHTPCHPSRRTENDIKREIALVYSVTITSVKYPPNL